jgi:hypothetical protein
MHSGAYIGAYTNMLLLHYDSTYTKSCIFGVSLKVCDEAGGRLLRNFHGWLPNPIADMREDQSV